MIKHRSEKLHITFAGGHDEKLKKRLLDIDHKNYGAYKAIKGNFIFEHFKLTIDHVQGDPFATPTRINVQIDSNKTGFDSLLWSNSDRETAFEDFISRELKTACINITKGSRGNGKSGLITLHTNQQQVLKRNSVLIRDNILEARLFVGLPAAGRRILANEAVLMFFKELPQIILKSMFYQKTRSVVMKNHIVSVEDQAFLRRWLNEENLAAFVAKE